ncbi:hypothetical protein D3C77_388330 [compost metagenome]
MGQFKHFGITCDAIQGVEGVTNTSKLIRRINLCTTENTIDLPEGQLLEASMNVIG